MSYPWNPVSPVGMDDSMEYQDERMVEELLIPNVQAQTCAPEESQYPLSAGPSRQTRSRCQVHSTSTSDHSPAFDPPNCSSPTSSFFTSKDPFYIAQLQETQIQARAWNEGQAHSANALARLGKPDEASPFLLVPQTQTQTPHQQQAQYHQGAGGDTYSGVGPYADLLYQREQMYHHQYCAATAVGS